MPFSYEVAKQDQEEMSKLIKEEPISIKNIEKVLGLDVSYTKEYSCSAAVVYNVAEKKIEEAHSAIIRTKVPYVSGFLGFREISAFMAAVHDIDLQDIDLIMVDGHGRFHPRMAGSASHVYLVMKRPTIGVAKNPLRADKIDEDGRIWLRGKLVGMLLSSPEGARKLYVSVGGGLELNVAFQIVKMLRRSQGLPTPLDYADMLSKKVMKIALSGS